MLTSGNVVTLNTFSFELNSALAKLESDVSNGAITSFEVTSIMPKTREASITVLEKAPVQTISFKLRVSDAD